MLTAYDTPGARIADAAGVDIILVGDSLANAVLGHKDTLQVDTAAMAHHVAAVARAGTRALVVGDMPWLELPRSVEDAVRNAAVLVRAGAGAVKLRGPGPSGRHRGPGRRRPGLWATSASPPSPSTPWAVTGSRPVTGRGRDPRSNDAKALGLPGMFRHRPRRGARRGRGPG